MTLNTRPADYNEPTIWEACGRCDNSSGSVSWGVNVTGAVNLVNKAGQVVGQRSVPQVCFECNGAGGKRVSQATLDRREKDRARRETKRQAEQAGKFAKAQVEAAQRKAEWTTWVTANQEAVDFILAARSGEPGTFMWDMQFRIITEERPLTEKQLLAVQRIMAARKADAETSAPVIEGRIVVTGLVIRVKEQESMYGLTVKMLVKDDRGFKVWGTVPSSILGQGCTDRRVAFTATVKASEDDATFGFFSRPSKASLLD